MYVAGFKGASRALVGAVLLSLGVFVAGSVAYVRLLYGHDLFG